MSILNKISDLSFYDSLIKLNKDEYVELAWSGTDLLGVRDPKVYMVCAGGVYPSALINMTLVR